MSQVLTSYLNRPKIYTPDDAAFYTQYGDWPKDISAYLVSSLSFDDYETNSLGAAIADTSTTSIAVSSAVSLATPFFLTVDTETMQVTAKDGTTLTITRGANSTAASAHSSGATAYAWKITDNGTAGLSWTPVGNAHIRDGHLVLDGSLDYIYPADSSLFAYGDADFTEEMWIYPGTNSNGVVIDGNSVDLACDGAIISIRDNNLLLFNFKGDNLSGFANGTIGQNVWHHIAVCRWNGASYGFINGNLMGSTVTAYNCSSTKRTLGSYAGRNNYCFNGYVARYRAYNGIALYTATFTPPARTS